jgi:hypothetical protein
VTEVYRQSDTDMKPLRGCALSLSPDRLHDVSFGCIFSKSVLKSLYQPDNPTRVYHPKKDLSMKRVAPDPKVMERCQRHIFLLVDGNYVYKAQPQAESSTLKSQTPETNVYVEVPVTSAAGSHTRRQRLVGTFFEEVFVA